MVMAIFRLPVYKYLSEEELLIKDKGKYSNFKA